MAEVDGIVYKIVIDPKTGIASLRLLDAATARSTAGLMAHQAALASTGTVAAAGLGRAAVAGSALRGIFTGLGSAVTGLTGGIGGLVAIIGAGVGLVAVVGLAIKAISTLKDVMEASIPVAREFEFQISRVGAITQSTAQELELLAREAIKHGEATIFTARQVAEAQFTLAKAGFTVAENLESMGALLDFAAAGQLGMAEAAQIAADAMRQLNKPASELTHIMDIMTAAATKSNQGLGDVGTAMRYVGTLATQLGISAEELGATLTVLANAGLRGSFAGTGLRQVLVTLNDEVRNGERNVGRLGKTLFDADGKLIGLADAFEKIQRGGTAAIEMTTLFETRAGVAATVVANQTERIRELTEAFHNVDGITKQIAEKNLDNLYGAQIRFTSAVEATQIELGRLVNPIGRAVIDDMITPIIKGFRAWLTDNQRLRLAIIDTGIKLLELAKEVAIMMDAVVGLAGGFDIFKLSMIAINSILDEVSIRFKEMRESLALAFDALATVLQLATVMVPSAMTGDVMKMVVNLKIAADELRKSADDAKGAYAGFTQAAIDRLKKLREELASGKLGSDELDKLKQQLLDAQRELDELLNRPNPNKGTKSALDELGLSLDVDIREKMATLFRALDEAIKLGEPRLVAEVADLFQKLRDEAHLDLKPEDAKREIEALNIAMTQAFQAGRLDLVKALEERLTDIQDQLRGVRVPESSFNIPIKPQLEIDPEVATADWGPDLRALREQAMDMLGFETREVKTTEFINVDGMIEQVTRLETEVVPILQSFESQYMDVMLRMLGFTDDWALGIASSFDSLNTIADSLDQVLGKNNAFSKGIRKVMALELLVTGTKSVFEGAVKVASSIWPPNPIQLAGGLAQIAQGTAAIAKAKELGASGGGGGGAGAGAGGGGGGGIAREATQVQQQNIKTIAESMGSEFVRAAKAAGLTSMMEPGSGDLPTWGDSIVKAYGGVVRDELHYKFNQYIPPMERISEKLEQLVAMESSPTVSASRRSETSAAIASEIAATNVYVQAMDSQSFERWLDDPRRARAVTKATIRTLED